jgi:type I restriction enzyme M protein
MDYWAETMQDDCYLIAMDGWKAETSRVIVTDKKGKEKDKGWTCDLIPKSVIVARYFTKEQGEIDDLTAALEATSAELAGLTEEHATDGGALDLESLKRAEVSARLKEIAKDKDAQDEAVVIKAWLDLNAQETDLKKRLKDAELALDAAAFATYPELSELDIKTLVVGDKWLGTLDERIHGEMDRVSHQLTRRVSELTDRYSLPLRLVTESASQTGEAVTGWLSRMGFICA